MRGALCIKRGGGRVYYRYAKDRRRAVFVQFAWPVFGAFFRARVFSPQRGGGTIIVSAARNVKNGFYTLFSLKSAHFAEIPPEM